MSCVTSMTAAPCSLHRRLSSEMICAWIDTSSAVVGSSATISRGSPASASAMTTRWRMPPENWCGYWSRRSSAAGMPVSWSSRIARRRASAALSDRCVWIVSISCWPMVYSGSSEVSGSWKMAPIERPRILRISLVRQVVDAAAVEADLAAADAPGRIEQADDRRAGERLAGARLADHAEDLARRDLEGDVVERDQRAAPPGEFDAQVRDLEQRRGHLASCSAAAACSRRPVPRSRRGCRSPRRAGSACTATR